MFKGKKKSRKAACPHCGKMFTPGAGLARHAIACKNKKKQASVLVVTPALPPVPKADSLADSLCVMNCPGCGLRARHDYCEGCGVNMALVQKAIDAAGIRGGQRS